MVLRTNAFFSLTAPIFLLLTSSSRCQAENAGSVEFNEFVDHFHGCAIQLHNYKNLPLQITRTPVSIQGNAPFELQPKVVTRKSCLALIYILPTITANSDPDPDRKEGQKGGTPSSRNAGNLEKTLTAVGQRYDILVSQDDTVRSEWGAAYKNLYGRGTLSHGVMVSPKEPLGMWQQDTLQLDTKLHIVNKLQMAKGHLVAPAVNFARLPWGGIGKAIEAVNDLGENGDVDWELYSLNSESPISASGGKPRLSSQDQVGRKLWNRWKTGPWNIKELLPENVFMEGLANYALAYLILRSNVSLRPVPNTPVWFKAGGSGLQPTITFGVKNGKYMQEPGSQSFGFISCAATPYRRRGGRTPILQVVSEILSIFEMRVYLALVVTYVVPCCLLGYLYHNLLKQRIDKKYWILWHPFTWGLRALLWQSGDRRWHSKRFGFTGWIAGPSALMAVIISYAFRGENLSILRHNGNYWEGHRRASIRELWRSGIKMVTDHPVLRLELPEVNDDLESYTQLAKMVGENGRIAYLTWWHRAKRVAERVQSSKGQGDPGICEDGSPVRKEKLGWWDFEGFTRNPRRENNVYGWEVTGWGDDKVIRRLKLVQRESHLMAQLANQLEAIGKLSGNNDYSVIYALNLNGNLAYLFMGGLLCLLLISGIWAGEVLWGQFVLAPKRRRLLQKKKDMDAGGEVIREGSSRQSSAGGGDVEEADLMAEAMALADREEVRRGGSVGAVSVGSVVMKERMERKEGKIREKMEKSDRAERNVDVSVDPAVQRQQEEDRIDVVDSSVAEEDDSEDSVTESEMDSLEADSDFEGEVDGGQSEEQGFRYTIQPQAPSPTPAIVSTTACVHVEGNETGTGKKRAREQRRRSRSVCSQQQQPGNIEEQESSGIGC